MRPADNTPAICLHLRQVAGACGEATASLLEDAAARIEAANEVANQYIWNFDDEGQIGRGELGRIAGEVFDAVRGVKKETKT